jgi:solute carrier family 25 (adenine nucleotide translocator) protein 4/5/6/31
MLKMIIAFCCDSFSDPSVVVSPQSHYFRKYHLFVGDPFWFKIVIRYSPIQALNFTVKESLRSTLNITNEMIKKDGLGAGWLAANMTNGAVAGAISLFCIYPTDISRVRLANDSLARMKARQQLSHQTLVNSTTSNGLIDVFRKIIRNEGIRGLYRGFMASCSGTMVYRSLYFGLFDSLKPFLLNGYYSKDSFFASFALAWPITIFAGIASYPFDIVRRRMTIMHGALHDYSSSFDCFRQVCAVLSAGQ